jgi:hypothetical protein
MPSRFVSLDSRDRDASTSDTPGDYVVRLMEDVNDVCSVQVRSFDIPKMWNLPPGRTTIWVSVSGGAFVAVEIEPGDHTPSSARDSLKAALDVAVPSLGWAVQVGDSGHFVISASQSFSVRGGDGTSPDGYGRQSAGKVLGFQKTATTPGTMIRAPHSHQLANRNESMYLHVEDYDAVQGGNGGVHNCTEVITPTLEKNTAQKSHEHPAEKHFHPPIARISRLRVRILDWYGQVVDFDNRDNRVDLEFTVRDSKLRHGAGYKPTSF